MYEFVFDVFEGKNRSKLKWK